MASKNIIKEKTYNIAELAQELGISYKSTRNKLSARGLKKVCSLNGLSLYSKAHLESLQAKRKYTPLQKLTPKQSPGFIIYESKINNYEID